MMRNIEQGRAGAFPERYLGAKLVTNLVTRNRTLEVFLASMIIIKYSSLLLVSGPEFHEEWLRDGPCDATTTGLSNSGSGVNSLPMRGT